MRSIDSMILLLTIITSIDAIPGDGGPDDKNIGKSMIYNDGQLVVLNGAAFDAENIGTWDEDIELNKFIPPISDSDIKCMMHVDRYCSKEMAHTKGLVIKALNDDCENCTIQEKDSVGKIVASMWTHHAEYWKLFLTRFDSIKKLERIIG